MSNIAKRHGLLFLLVAAAMVLAAGTSLCAGERTLAEFAAILQGKIADNTKVNLPQGVAVLGAEQRSGQLVILDPSRDWSAPEALLWHWDPSKAPGLEPAARRLFGTFSECKAVRGGSQILTADSRGGVALIRRSDKEVLFHGRAGQNPHSAELLPDGNIVAAASMNSNVVIYAVGREPMKECQQAHRVYELKSAHGLVWDNSHRLLWALGSEELLGYRYNFSKADPALTVAVRVALEGPAAGGHDLYPVGTTPFLLMTGLGVSLFDTRTREIMTLAEVKQVKSLVLSGVGENDIMIAQITREKWWSDTIHVFNRDLTPLGIRRDARFYKARLIAR